MTLPSSRRDDAERVSLTGAQWQIYEAGWNDTARFRVAVCGRRFGKALATDTLLPSPDGWTTMGAVVEGDRLYDDTGATCTVVFATEVMHDHPCYRLRFDDAEEIVADRDHRWVVAVEDDPTALIVDTERLAAMLAQGRACHVRCCEALWDTVREDRIVLRRILRRHGCRESGCWVVRSDERTASDILIRSRRLGLAPHRATGADGTTVSVAFGKKGRRRRIVSVIPVPSVPVRCIQVDSPSRLFLCGRGFVPTHNTFLMAEELRRAARHAVRRRIGPENEIWYGAPTFLQAKRVMWSRLKRTIPERWLRGRPNETECSLRLLSGHVIRIVGLDAAENLRGSGLWFFGGDEWADCRPQAWSEVIRPMLSTSRGHALFVGTPKGFDHFRDAYLLGQPGGDPAYRSFMFTTEAGGNVPREEVEAARAQLDARTFRQEYCASFETFSGRVVYAFERASHVRSCPLDPRRPVHVGIDFNINPMSATVWQEEGSVALQVGEIVLPTSNTDELAAEIIVRFGRPGFGAGRPDVGHITVYPDPAGAQRRSSAGGRTDIGILRENGFTVVAPRSHPSVRDRLNVTNRQFMTASGRMEAFVDPSCVKSIEAYERLAFREGSMEPDKGSGYDHLVDATGYFLHARHRPVAAASASTFMGR